MQSNTHTHKIFFKNRDRQTERQTDDRIYLHQENILELLYVSQGVCGFLRVFLVDWFYFIVIVVACLKIASHYVQTSLELPV